MSSTSDPIRVVAQAGMPHSVFAEIAALAGVRAVEAEAPDIADALAGAQVLVTFRWSDEWLVRSLRWVQSVSTGYEQFPLPTLQAAGVALTTARGVHGPQMSEHVFGLLFGLTRGIAAAVRRQAVHRWKWSAVEEMSGRTMGILGLGSIGEEVAVRARAFGMRVIGVKRDPSQYSGVAEKVVGPDRLIEVCHESDVVVSTLPGGPETDGIVSREAIEAIGAGWFISVGRGAVVDEAALLDALTTGDLRGAGLDVFATEPLPDDSPFWDLPNVIVTPHCAGVSPRYGERLAGIFAQNLAALRGDGEWVNRVV